MQCVVQCVEWGLGSQLDMCCDMYFVPVYWNLCIVSCGVRAMHALGQLHIGDGVGAVCCVTTQGVELGLWDQLGM